jgi:hypothetical protein
LNYSEYKTALNKISEKRLNKFRAEQDTQQWRKLAFIRIKQAATNGYIHS